MKTLLISILMILVLGSAGAKPIRDVISVKEPVQLMEGYVDDIPFNTGLIAMESRILNDGREAKGEANVDDIPFDTRRIAQEALLTRMITAYVEAEVNDIPFDTRRIYEEYLMAVLMKDYKNEKGATDITFDTRRVAGNALLAEAVAGFREEAEVNDIPFETVCIISANYSNEPAYVVVKRKSDRKSSRKNSRHEDYYYSIIHPYRIELSAPVLDHSTLTRELKVIPGSSL